MSEAQGSADHPRSDEVRGRPDQGYEAGFGDGGLNDRGGIGDEGVGPTARRANPDDAGDGAPTAPGTSGAGSEDSGGYADQADYGDLPRER